MEKEIREILYKNLGYGDADKAVEDLLLLFSTSKSIICPNCEEDCQPIPLGHFCNKCYYDKL